jgi:hypothetical protein
MILVSSNCLAQSHDCKSLDRDKYVALDATCVNTEPDDQCVDLAECKDDGGFKCFCKAANYKSGSLYNNKGMCKTILVYNFI